jgi:hypothetical protein
LVRSYLIGVLSCILTTKYSKLRKPRYSTHSNNLLEGSKIKIDGVEIKFSGFSEPVSNLTVTKLVFWNAGAGTITKKDVLPSPDLLCIQIVRPYKILDASTLHVINSENGFDVTRSRERDKATVKFEYMNHNEGVIIEVIHTGTKDEDVRLEGTIRDAGRIKRIPFVRKRRQAIFQIVNIMFAGAAAVLLIRGIAALAEGRRNGLMTSNDWMLLGGLFVFAIMMIIVIALVRRLPRGFELFEQDV